MADPVHQFSLYKLIPLEIGGVDISFTNSALYMTVIVAATSGFLILSTSGRGLIPTRAQSLSEMFYEFVAQMLRDQAGSDGMRFFPFVFSIFMFVFMANVIGLIPYTFSVTSQLVVTGALALFIILLVVVYGVYRNGVKFLNLFVPSGVPTPLLFIVAPLEVFSFLTRPVSLSVRLFANMLAGHITLKVFAGFIIAMAGVGFTGVVGAVLPFIMVVLLEALEALVAVLQAYVFAVLTCMYLHDAIHPGH